MQVLAQGMSSDIDRMTTVSMNMANVRTPGYKRLVATGASFDDLVNRGERNEAARTAKLSDMGAGAIQQTGRPLDVAITGPYFFELMAGQRPVYSRQGSFQLDAQGRLIGVSGNPVMGAAGEIRLTSAAPEIDAQGHIYENGRLVDQLKLVRIDHAEKMQRAGQGVYELGGLTAELAESGTTAIRQGALEASNVDSAREMVSVMEIVRHFESMQKVAQSYDDMTSRAIQKLGDL